MQFDDVVTVLWLIPFLKLGPTSGCFIYSRTGTSPTYTQVIVQILHLTHIIDGQLRHDNLEQVHLSEISREKSWLAGDSNPRPSNLRCHVLAGFPSLQ